MVLYSPEEVAEKAIFLLKDIYTNLGPKLQANQVNWIDYYCGIWIETFLAATKQLYDWFSLSVCTAIKPPKAACQFAADDILLYKFAIISNGFTSPFGKKEKKNCHLYNTILSLYISYQDITRRVC